ncbi:MAG: flagellar motor protein MotB [Bacteroidetes bacterium]|nr:MAG: flagellar motor protein MotB [Bacteroidota bacterium]
MKFTSPAFLISLLCLLSATACVSTKKYRLALGEASVQDSLRQAREREIGKLTQQVAGLAADTSGQGRQLRDWQDKYQKLSMASSAEKGQLSQALDTRTAELNQKNKELENKQKAIEIYARELESREAKVNELSAIIRRQDSLSQALLGKVKNALVGFGQDELTVSMKEGKVYVSLSEQLLFQSGSADVNQKGRDALLKLAEVLNKNPDIQVFIEGHTDNVPIKTAVFKDNWDLSVLRATSVVRILLWGGKMDPKRLIPSGRSEYFPVASNEDKESRKLNRRTEIILSPKLDELMSLLESSGNK